MFRSLALFAASLLLSVLPAAAEVDRITLGWGRLFTNDALGDMHDRWRTGSYTLSRIRGPQWEGVLPSTPGEIVELRLRAETVAPADLVTPEPDDRRFAGLLGLGIHTHFLTRGIETSAGVDLAITGPQTGLGRFQRQVHDLLDLPRPQVLDDQIPDEVHFQATVELGRPVALGKGTFRPFVEVQAGLEDLVRAGADLSFGTYTKGALMVREAVTGQRYRAVPLDRLQGYSFTVGADAARVFDSALLPEGGAAELSDQRHRVRAGVHWQGETSEVFYGLTWMGEEFAQQPETQMLGSVNLRLRF